MENIQNDTHLQQLIDNGEMPPRRGDYGGINSFCASSTNPSEIMNEISNQIHNMNGDVLVQEPFRVMWRLNIGNVVDTVFTVWLRSDDPDSIFVYFDLIGRFSRNYLIYIFPMIQNLFQNGTFVQYVPFIEEEWHKKTIERILQMHQHDMQILDDLLQEIDILNE